MTKRGFCAIIYYCILASAVAKERQGTIGASSGLFTGTPVWNWATILLTFDLLATHFDSLATDLVALVTISTAITLAFATGQVTGTQLLVRGRTGTKLFAGFGFRGLGCDF